MNYVTSSREIGVLGNILLSITLQTELEKVLKIFELLTFIYIPCSKFHRMTSNLILVLLEELRFLQLPINILATIHIASFFDRNL